MPSALQILHLGWQSETCPCETNGVGSGHVSYEGIPNPFMQHKLSESFWHELPQTLHMLNITAIVVNLPSCSPSPEAISDLEIHSHQQSPSSILRGNFKS